MPPRSQGHAGPGGVQHAQAVLHAPRHRHIQQRDLPHRHRRRQPRGAQPARHRGGAARDALHARLQLWQRGRRRHRLARAVHPQPLRRARAVRLPGRPAGRVRHLPHTRRAGPRQHRARDHHVPAHGRPGRQPVAPRDAAAQGRRAAGCGPGGHRLHRQEPAAAAEPAPRGALHGARAVGRPGRGGVTAGLQAALRGHGRRRAGWRQRGRRRAAVGGRWFWQPVAAAG